MFKTLNIVCNTGVIKHHYKKTPKKLIGEVWIIFIQIHEKDENEFSFKTLTAQKAWMPSIGQNMQPVTDTYGDVSMWMKTSWVGQTVLNKERNNCVYFYLFYKTLKQKLWQRF